MENNVLSGQTHICMWKRLWSTPHHQLVNTCQNLCGGQHCILYVFNGCSWHARRHRQLKPMSSAALMCQLHSFQIAVDATVKATGMPQNFTHVLTSWRDGSLVRPRDWPKTGYNTVSRSPDSARHHPLPTCDGWALAHVMLNSLNVKRSWPMRLLHRQ